MSIEQLAAGADLPAEEAVEGVPPEHMPIYRLEAELARMPQIELQLEHEFCNGLYARTIYIPAGTALTGAVHVGECFFLVRQGELLVTTDKGSQRIGPGFMTISQANSKRAGYAITDAVVTTFHPNPDNETDPQVLWDTHTAPAPQSALEAVQHPHLENE